MGTMADLLPPELLNALANARRRAGDLAGSVLADPAHAGADFAKGAASGAAQMPFDLGAFLAPGLGLVAPAGASVLQPLADRTQAWLDQSPLGTHSDAGELGKFLAQLAMPFPGGARLTGEINALSDLALSKRLARFTKDNP